MHGGKHALSADYFADNPLHCKKTFRRCFRMNRNLFLRIVHGVRELDSYFVCKRGCTGTIRFFSLQKCTVALSLLAYGAPADSQDDYLRMAESTVLECFYRFCRAVVGAFGLEYLRTHCGRHCSDPSQE